MYTEWVSEVAQSCPTLFDPMYYSPPAHPSMAFSRQEYWSGLPFPSPGDLPDPGINPSLPQYRQALYCLSCQGSLHHQWPKWPEQYYFYFAFFWLKYRLRYRIYTTVNLALFLVFLLLLIEYAHILEFDLLSASYIIPLKAWGREGMWPFIVSPRNAPVKPWWTCDMEDTFSYLQSSSALIQSLSPYLDKLKDQWRRSGCGCAQD